MDSLFSLYENRYNESESGTFRRDNQDPDADLRQGSSKWMYTEHDGSSSSSSYIHGPNELNRYLQMDLSVMTMKEKRDMDIIQWWNQHESRFPIVAQMARDILSMLVSTIASQSTFSTSGQIVENRRCSLTNEMIEVITCLLDWTHVERRLQ